MGGVNINGALTPRGALGEVRGVYRMIRGWEA